MKLWLLWLLASVVSFGLGGRLGRTLGPTEDVILVGYLSLSMSLLLVGLLQWALLHPAIGIGATWAAASVAAVVALGALVYLLGAFDPDVGWVLGVVLGWALLGVFQGMLLRDAVSGAGWWVAVHAAALIMAGPGVGFVTWLAGAPVDTPFGNQLRWAAFGTVYGVTTGSALWWLLRDRLAQGA